MPVVLISDSCEGCDDAGIEVCKARRITAGNCYRGEIKTDKPDVNRCRRYDQSDGPICSICGIPHLDCSHGLISEIIIDGTAKAQEHYQGDVQPIEFMQSVLPTEAFIGYLQGNLIKYVSRLGKKDAVEKECDKIQQYAFWLSCAVRGEKIDPRK